MHLFALVAIAVLLSGVVELRQGWDAREAAYRVKGSKAERCPRLTEPVDWVSRVRRFLAKEGGGLR
jgi:hypothetical protein